MSDSWARGAARLDTFTAPLDTMNQRTFIFSCRRSGGTLLHGMAVLVLGETMVARTAAPQRRSSR
jgi:hypothetical protein